MESNTTPTKPLSKLELYNAIFAKAEEARDDVLAAEERVRTPAHGDLSEALENVAHFRGRLSALTDAAILLASNL